MCHGGHGPPNGVTPFKTNTEEHLYIKNESVGLDTLGSCQKDRRELVHCWTAVGNSFEEVKKSNGENFKEKAGKPSGKAQ